MTTFSATLPIRKWALAPWGGHDDHVDFFLFDLLEDFPGRVADRDMTHVRGTAFQVFAADRIQTLPRFSLGPRQHFGGMVGFELTSPFRVLPDIFDDIEDVNFRFVSAGQ